jgi:hypothetical protein
MALRFHVDQESPMLERQCRMAHLPAFPLLEEGSQSGDCLDGEEKGRETTNEIQRHDVLQLDLPRGAHDAQDEDDGDQCSRGDEIGSLLDQELQG